MRPACAGWIGGLLLLALAPAAAASGASVHRAWIDEMKRSPRGPFDAIRWFCNDGAVLPPGPGACRERGGGIQHGLWSARTRELRARGYRIANVLAAVDPAELTGPGGDPDRLAWLVLERFLASVDDGWILRGARSYRGAFQIEDEEAAARRLLEALVTDPAWRAPARFALLREAVRWLPSGRGAGSTADVRQRASDLAARDPGFAPLRNKIHGLPDHGDAARVRDHALARGASDLAPDYERLAVAIDSLSGGAAEARALDEVSRRVADGPLTASLAAARAALAETAPRARLAGLAASAAALRDAYAGLSDAAQRVAALEASLILEDRIFATASEPSVIPGAVASRRDALGLLLDLMSALHGAGLLSDRQRDAARDGLVRLLDAESLRVDRYREELRYLARVPGWAQRGLAFHFEPTVEKLATLEPLVHLYLQDRLRGSPLLAFGAQLDALLLDANERAGVEHTLFGERVGGGLRPLNPGLTRGVLEVVEPGAPEGAELRRDGIYLLPQTISELPPVAGILTRGEGSSLSHVQLLARNLGIPNVVVDESLVPRLAARQGQRVVLAVSPLGVVELAADAPRFDAVLGREAPEEELQIRPDLEKLDLVATRLLPLEALRAGDSGRVVGPKAANLAELRHLYGEAVPPAVAVPFGVFRRLLERPLEPGGPPVFDWMRERYAALRALEDRPEEQQAEVRAFLGRLRAWIEAQDPGDELRERLRAALGAAFGPEDTGYGVFVRSDTNVEDLPGFTGAGLNLTVPNVVGFENAVRALGRVWASPFTERAYAWRQAHMERPELVFPAVLLQRSFASEKSGVLVTADVETGDPAWISVAVSEGVGGAVEGQAAEELRIERETGRVRLLAQASAPHRAALDPAGGLRRLPASGAEAVLSPGEIDALLGLARELPVRVPALRDAEGRELPADVEFAFGEGRLVLLQIRPFVESRRARGSRYLQHLGRRALARAAGAVDLDAPPGGGGSAP